MIVEHHLSRFGLTIELHDYTPFKWGVRIVGPLGSVMMDKDRMEQEDARRLYDEQVRQRP